MMQQYNRDHRKIGGLASCYNVKIEADLKTGDKKLAFSFPTGLYDLTEENYIATKTEEYIVKSVTYGRSETNVTAQLNVEELEGREWEEFESTEQTMDACLRLAFSGTPWTVGECSLQKKRTVKRAFTNAWDILQDAVKTYRAEIQIDSLNKTVRVYERLGSDQGVYFMDSVNLDDFSVSGSSSGFYTRILPIGKDGLQLPEKYLENHQFSVKVKTLIWKDERYTEIESLREDARAKLEELSKPERSYSASIVDLAAAAGRSPLSYSLGDTVTLVDRKTSTREKQRIVKLTQYPETPLSNSVQLASRMLTFEELQQENKVVGNTVKNITADDGTVSLKAVDGVLERTSIITAHVQDLNAVNARVGDLEANSATISQLEAARASIEELDAEKASITDLDAASAKISQAEIGLGKINTLLTGSATVTEGQIIKLTAENTTIDNLLVKNQIAANLQVKDLLAGDISTNKFRVASDSGNMLLADNTMQISDGQKVRVQLGRTAGGDYTLAVWDSAGTLMWDARGLTAAAVKDKIIRDDMISDSANISGGKLNLPSLITGINNGKQTIKSSLISYDPTGQTLDVAFNNISQKVENIGGVQLLRDSAFEHPEQYWNCTSGVTVDTTVKHRGHNSVRFETFNTLNRLNGSIQKNYIPYQYEPLTISVWYMCPDVSKIPANFGHIRSDIYFMNSSNQFVANSAIVCNCTAVDFRTAGSGVWVRKTISAVPSQAGITKFRLSVFATMTDGSAGQADGFKIYLSEPKIERGRVATEWNPAPEDVQDELETTSTAIHAAQGEISALISNTTITSESGESTLLKDAFTSLSATVDGVSSVVGKHSSSIGELENTAEVLNSRIDQTAKDITMRFSQAQTATSGVDEDLQSYKSTIDTYIRFDPSGISLGRRDSPFQTVLGSGRLSFLQDGAEVAYISNNKLYITSAEVLDRLTLGKSASGFFDFVPRASGNLGVKWRNV